VKRHAPRRHPIAVSPVLKPRAVAPPAPAAKPPKVPPLDTWGRASLVLTVGISAAIFAANLALLHQMPWRVVVLTLACVLLAGVFSVDGANTSFVCRLPGLMRIVGIALSVGAVVALAAGVVQLRLLDPHLQPRQAGSAVSQLAAQASSGLASGPHYLFTSELPNLAGTTSARLEVNVDAVNETGTVTTVSRTYPAVKRRKAVTIESTSGITLDAAGLFVRRMVVASPVKHDPQKKGPSVAIVVRGLPANSFLVAKGATKLQVEEYGGQESVSWLQPNAESGVEFTYVQQPFNQVRLFVAPVLGAQSVDQLALWGVNAFGLTLLGFAVHALLKRFKIET